MPFLVLILLLTFALASPQMAVAQEAFEPESVYNGSTVRRWSVVVSDLDETVKLYRDILGFELGDIRLDKKNSYVFDVFNIDRKIDTQHVTFHEGERKRMISAVVVPKSSLPRPPKSPYMSAILLNVNGQFDQVVSRLRTAGYQVFDPHVLGSRGMEVGFVDKDGHLHVIYEFPYVGSNYKELISNKLKN